MDRQRRWSDRRSSRRLDGARPAGAGDPPRGQHHQHQARSLTATRCDFEMKDKSFGERLSASNSAKQAMTTKFLQRPAPDDPAVVEQRAARVALSEAREARRAEREASRLAEDARTAAERRAHEAAAEQDAGAAAERAAHEAQLKIQSKVARDARYA